MHIKFSPWIPAMVEKSGSASLGEHCADLDTVTGPEISEGLAVFSPDLLSADLQSPHTKAAGGENLHPL